MNSFVPIVGQMLLIFAVLALIIASVAVFSWHVVYDLCRCRNHPIQKTVLVCAAGLWLIFAAYVAII